MGGQWEASTVHLNVQHTYIHAQRSQYCLGIVQQYLKDSQKTPDPPLWTQHNLSAAYVIADIVANRERGGGQMMTH